MGAIGHPRSSSRCAPTRATGAGARSGKAYEQVNWDLFDQFASMINGASWDVAFFQEFPRAGRRRWLGPAVRAHRALSGRNWLQPLTSIIGRWRPDLLGPGREDRHDLGPREAGPIVERRRVVLTRCLSCE